MLVRNNDRNKPKKDSGSSDSSWFISPYKESIITPIEMTKVHFLENYSNVCTKLIPFI